jgi:hypothetical protein
MPKYQPVSLNSIRAAIQWGGLPTPRLKQVWVFAPAGRRPWSTVHAYFNRREIEDLCLADDSTRGEVFAWLRCRLSDSFAQDIQVALIMHRPGSNELCAMLTCSVLVS